MLTKLKQRAQSWLAIGAQLFHHIGFTPNHVSIIGIILAVLSAVTYWQWESHPFLIMLASLLMLVSGLFDSLDGALARIYCEMSTFGGFFDSLLDRYADSIILCGIILGGLTDIKWGLAALVGSMLVSYARARAESAGVKMESVGLAERAERIVILTLISLMSYVWLEAINWGILILAVITNVTVIQRAFYFRKASKRIDRL